MNDNLVTIKQANILSDLGYIACYPIIPTVDQAIDWIRRKFNIIVYDATEPYVHPINNCIIYCYKVKYCSKKWGWNQREYIGTSKWSKNSYAMKRQAIWIALRYILKKEKDAARRKNCKNRKRRL